jgi:hypothetical protein
MTIFVGGSVVQSALTGWRGIIQATISSTQDRVPVRWLNVAGAGANIDHPLGKHVIVASSS